MTKCPNCGSTAQVRFIDSEFMEESSVEVLCISNYKCGCGTHFKTGKVYFSEEDEVVIEEKRL